MLTSPVKLVFLIRVGGVIQVMRCASRAQKISGVSRASADMAAWRAAVTSVLAATSGLMAMSVSLDMRGTSLVSTISPAARGGVNGEKRPAAGGQRGEVK
jgi:hypothetical protein